MYMILFLLFSVSAQEPQNSDEDVSKPIQNQENTVLNTQDSRKEEEPPEIIIFGEREVDIRREKLEHQLYENGYREGIQKEGRTVYRPETSWKPSFVVYDSGFVELKRTPPRFESYLKHRNDIWRYLACVPPFTVMCIDVNGWMINERKLRHAKEDIVVKTHDNIVDWQQALEKMTMEERIHNSIPFMLDMVWQQGILPDGTKITTSKEKLEWIFAFYDARLCNDYGVMVRDVIETYIEEEIRTTMQQDFPSDLWEQKIGNICQHK